MPLTSRIGLLYTHIACSNSSSWRRPQQHSQGQIQENTHPITTQYSGRPIQSCLLKPRDYLLLLPGDNDYKEFPTALKECSMTSWPVPILLKKQIVNNPTVFRTLHTDDSRSLISTF
ncbi:unnamed protein product [Ectocarpus sp. 12 AP-2014]